MMNIKKEFIQTIMNNSRYLKFFVYTRKQYIISIYKNTSIKYYCIILMFSVNISFSQPYDEKEELDMSYSKSVVPMVRVLSCPSQYDGKEITFTGYYHLETHLSAVFSDKDSCLEYSTENAILLNVSLPKEIKYQHCDRLTVKGVLNHSREYYGMRSKSDLYLENTIFID